MVDSYIFISYKHAGPSTKIARAFYDHLDAISDGLGLSVFMDDVALRASDNWKDEVNKALEQTTHFIALLSTQYWLSGECRRELRKALDGFETKGSPRLLFVMAESIRPDLFTFDKDRKSGELKTKNPRIHKVGDLHFLGPFDNNTRLVRLEWENPAKLSDQFSQLLDRLEATLSKHR
jgi:hypothetical protein